LRWKTILLITAISKEPYPRGSTAYFSPNRSVRELRELIKIGEGIDPLKEFSEAAREEMGKFKFT
jgi:hypothetical protein